MSESRRCEDVFLGLPAIGFMSVPTKILHVNSIFMLTRSIFVGTQMGAINLRRLKTTLDELLRRIQVGYDLEGSHDDEIEKLCAT